MVIRGLENYGYFDLAREIALEHLDRVAEVFHQTGTIWENYAPDSVHQGKPAKGDFVGWSGIGPILYLLEYAIGLKPNALHNELSWELRTNHRVGCDRYRFNGHVISLLGTPIDSGKGWEIAVRSDGQFTLRLQASGQMKRIAVEPGNTRVTILP
jgi:Trehalase